MKVPILPRKKNPLRLICIKDKPDNGEVDYRGVGEADEFGVPCLGGVRVEKLIDWL